MLSMWASGLAVILASISCCAATLMNVGAAQQKQASYGPAVSAYLTGLDEELNELEYQLRRDEIKRVDYERAKQRLTILRRSVEHYAAENRKDIVPEYQALAEDELKTVGLSREYKAEELIAGAELEGRWKIVGIQPAGERKSVRFLVLERLQQTAAVRRENKPARTIDPRDVIETIIVPETDSPFPPAPPPSNNQNPKVEAPVEAPKPGLQAPRLLSVMMPEYTGKARDRKIEGEVIVNALFQRDGKIKDAKVEKGLGFGLDERAVDAVKRMSFLPAQLDGKEVDARARIIVGFNLEKVYVYVGVAELVDAGQGEK
jgi:TonB family protein